MTRPNGWTIAGVIVVLSVAVSAQTFTSLVSFDGTDGSGPYIMSLVQGEDGNFYGTTEYGGSNFTCTGGCGTAFKVTPEGVLTTLYNFSWAGGGLPAAGLVEASDGGFYGTTSQGGNSGNGYGTVFKMTANGTLTTLHSFGRQTDGGYPQAPLFQATDGNFYGTTQLGGSQDKGTVFRITRGGVLTTLYSFCAEMSCVDGFYPMAGLIQAADGNLYGTTYYGGNPNCGGPNGCGTVFKISLQGKLTTLHAFNSLDGAYLFSGLLQGTDGVLYGTAPGGGTHNDGTVFGITTSGQFRTVHNFRGTDGAVPLAGVVEATDGRLYGATSEGGDLTCAPPSGCGTLFTINSIGQVTTLHDFEVSDGIAPLGALLQGTIGIFYGTTYQGGVNMVGTVFTLDTGLGPFVTFAHAAGKVGQTGPILGQGFTGTTSVTLNGIPASFTVESDTYVRATVPSGATTGYVTVTTPSGTLTSNVPFHVLK